MWTKFLCKYFSDKTEKSGSTGVVEKTELSTFHLLKKIPYGTRGNLTFPHIFLLRLLLLPYKQKNIYIFILFKKRGVNHAFYL